MKIIYKIGNEDKRVVSKILKMGKNNQYGNAMTKPLPTCSIKRKKIPTMREFDLITQGISDEDKIGHLFVVNIHFDKKKMLAKNNYSLTKYIHQFLKRKKFCQQTKDLFLNFLML